MSSGEPRRSPLDDTHRAAGAKLVDFGGWEMPLAYESGTLAEHMACRNEAAVFDVSHLGTVRIDDADGFARLQGSLTNDLTRIVPGRAQYTHLLDDDGSVVDDIIVWWIDEQLFDVMPNASNTAPVRNAVGGTDMTSSRAVLAVQGPQARQRLGTVCADAAAVARFDVRRVRWRGVELTIAGTGYTGEDGVEISIPAESAPAFWQEVVRAGITPAGLGARDTLRLEAGLPLHGHELGAGKTPLQAGLGWVIAWDKGDFPGRAALLDERERGVSRRLRGIVTEGRQPPRAHNSVLAKDSVVGEVSSGNFSPVLERGIAMAFLTPEVEFGDRVEIDVRGKGHAGTVTKMPFVRGSAGRS